MKTAILISVVVFSLFALVTAIKASNPVLDYGTGAPINWRGRYVIRAFWNEQHLYVGKMDRLYVGLELGQIPSRIVQLVPVRAVDQNGACVKTFINFRARFSNSRIYWNDLADFNRISETGNPQDGGAFIFQETKENRVYKMLYRFLNSQFFEVGIQVKTQDNKDTYYLATNRTRKTLPLPEEVVNQVRFTFEKL